ncbi:hypothetical protein LTR08_002539 [Meristemomyces frigidus]|nr:hypothetical protein LTR08_002539 [Meristemomyces frigidus]
MEGRHGDKLKRHYMQLALTLARKSPPKPTNFCVGACLVSPASSNTNEQGDGEAGPPLVTGYTLECPGNTHAEQSCFIKLAQQYSCTEEKLGEHLPEGTVLFTTMEPCVRRSVGNVACVDRIVRLKRKGGAQAVRTVYVGVGEPETFVGVNEGRDKLEKAGIVVEHVPGLEAEILAVATAGHVKDKEQ